MNVDNPRPSPLRKEQSHIPELLGEGSIGLQARLLLGDLDTPRMTISKKKLQPIQDYGALGMAEKTANMYQKASVMQRQRHQEETGLTFSRWKTGFDGYLESIRQDDARSERREFLATIGITDTVSAEAFYNEYLRGKSDVVRFVDTIERSATREQIVRHQDIIRDLGNAFGYGSSEVIDHLIHGVRNVKADMNAFIYQARKTVNSSAVFDNPLLQQIRSDSGVTKKADEGQKPVVKKTVSPAVKEPPVKPRATPVRRVTFEEDEEGFMPSPTPSARPERGRQPAKTTDEQNEEQQVFPAPIEESGEDQGVHLITQEELDAAMRLLYSDVYPQDIDKEVALLKATERINYYGRELHAMMQEYSRDVVLEKAANAVHLLQQYMNKIGLRVDKRSKSQSWYLWGIAKSRFLANNPGVQNALPNADKYDPFDPLLYYRVGTQSAEGQKSQKAENEIIEGMLGWEIYRQRKKLGRILPHLDPMMDQQAKERLLALLSEDPKKDQEPPTLSSCKLREIGRIVKINIPAT